VAKKTASAGFEPKRTGAVAPAHLVAVLAFDGVVLADLAAPCELLGGARDAQGRAAYEVRVCSPSRHVTTAYVALEVPFGLATLKRAATLIVPGIDDIDRPIDAALVRAISAAVARGARVASICSGALILAATGALDGKRATTHWRCAAELARRHPRIEVDAAVLYVDHGQLLTSAGAAAGLDLCLHLVRRDLGAQVAATVARQAVMPLERAGTQAQFIVHTQPTVEDGALGSLLLWLAQNLHRSLTLPTLARRARMSTRTLSRRFREQVGTTPALWVASARVREAQRLLETTRWSIERVAAEVGFRSPSILREHFRQSVGTSPQAYRRAFCPA
jgi:transcriptional regulator GlxA family with amidase domain